MQLISFEVNQLSSWGVIEKQQVRNLGALDTSGEITLGSALRTGKYNELIARSNEAPLLALAEVTYLPPIPDPKKILCVGLNYADHILEMNRDTPEKPVIFTRYIDSIVGHQEPLVAPAISNQFDFEGEFTIVIGKGGRHISPDRAMDHVLGYTIMNDGSIRDYQRHTHQFTPGKNFPQSGSTGPIIITADEFGPINAQRITTRLNQVDVQKSSLEQLVFNVQDLVSYCSEWTQLSPGDLIATGTPGGVGDSREPKLWLQPGDVVEVEVEGLGILSNTIVRETR